MKTNYKHIKALKNEVLNSEEVLSFIQNNPREFFEKINQEPKRIPWIYALIISIIGLAFVISVIYIAVIALADPHIIAGKAKSIEIPDVLVVVASSSIAVLAGLLAPSPLSSQRQEQIS
ncbi:hypothetical protein [Kordia sp.]|uniref:hypothetical protein n=1 Tax=Kordia sp. TaxID=1965332 RepID=UPI003D6C006B